MFEFLNAVFALVAGDYTAYWSGIGIQEDNPLIDVLFSLLGR